MVTTQRWVNFHEQRIFVLPTGELLLMVCELLIIIGLWIWFYWKYRTLKPLAELVDATKKFHSHSRQFEKVSASAPAEVHDMAAALLQLQEKIKSLLLAMSR